MRQSYVTAVTKFTVGLTRCAAKLAVWSRKKSGTSPGLASCRGMINVPNGGWLESLAASAALRIDSGRHPGSFLNYVRQSLDSGPSALLRTCLRRNDRREVDFQSKKEAPIGLEPRVGVSYRLSDCFRRFSISASSWRDFSMV